MTTPTLLSERPLLIQRPLRDGESLQSLLAWLHDANAYEPKRFMETIVRSRMIEAGDNLVHPHHPDTYRILSELVGRSVQELWQGTFHRYASIIDNAPIQSEQLVFASKGAIKVYSGSSKRIHYCPRCLQESDTHLIRWMNKWLVICDEHSCLLHDACPACQQALNVKSVVAHKCPACEFDLRTSPIHLVNSDSQNLIYSLFEKATILEGLPPVSIPDLLRLIRGLSRVVAHHPNLIDRSIAPIGARESILTTKRIWEPVQTLLLVDVAVNGLRDWPHGFHRFLDAITIDKTHRVQTDFGSLYTVYLEREWRDIACVQEAFNQYLQQSYPLSASVMKTQRVVDAPDYITVKEASDVLHVSESSLRTLIEANVIATHDDWTGRVLRKSVDGYRKQLDDALSLGETADRLNLSSSTVSELCQLGILTVVRGATVDETQKWRICPKSVGDLQAQITQSKPHRWKTIQSATRVLSRHQYTVALIIQAALEGHLTLYEQWLVCSEEIEKLRERLNQTKPILSVQESTKLLGLKRTHILKKWIARGLLTHPLERQKILKFWDNYVWTEQAAEIMGVGILTVQKWARNGRLHPISGGEVDGLHRYLFRREEVIRFRPNNRLTTPQMAKRLGLSRGHLIAKINAGTLDPMPVSGPTIDGCKHYLFFANSLPIATE